MTQRAARHAATALLLALAGLLVVLVTAGLARAATFTVNSTCDTGDASPDGTCNDGAGNCCLREAIDEVNGGSGGDTIARSGTLVIPPPSSELPVITQSVTIDFTPSSVGGLPGGAAPTTAVTLQGNGSLNYGLRFAGLGATFVVRGLRVEGFTETGAAALSTQSDAALTVEASILADGHHGIDCRSDCTVTDTLIDGNAVDGLFCVGGTITAERVEATDNEDGAYLSGCDGVSITNSHLTGNSHNGVNLDDVSDGGNGSDNATLDQITATGNGESGVNVQDNSDGLTLTDSTLGANTQYGVKFSANSNGATVTGNDFTQPSCNGINDYLDAGGNTFTDNELCPDPTPTNTPALAGCCNIAPGIEGANCLDESFAGTIDSLADCQAIADGFGSTASGFNPDALCDPDPAGSCPAPNTPTHTATATATRTGTATATATETDTPVPTDTDTPSATPTRTATSTPTNTGTPTPTGTPTNTAPPIVGTGPHFSVMQSLHFRERPRLSFEQEQRLHFEVTE